MARAPALQAGGQEFDSLYLHQKNGAVKSDRKDIWRHEEISVVKLLEEVNRKCILDIFE